MQHRCAFKRNGIYSFFYDGSHSVSVIFRIYFLNSKRNTFFFLMQRIIWPKNILEFRRTFKRLVKNERLAKVNACSFRVTMGNSIRKCTEISYHYFDRICISYSSKKIVDVWIFYVNLPMKSIRDHFMSNLGPSLMKHVLKKPD